MRPMSSVFVHVKTLHEGQSFVSSQSFEVHNCLVLSLVQGLFDMIFANQPTLSLVSNGGECILLHKESFNEIASDQYKKMLHQTQIPYPTDIDFRTAYQNHAVWTRLTKQIYVDTYQQLVRERSQHRPYSTRKNDSSYRRTKTCGHIRTLKRN
jgi:hypothetical protein